MFSKHGGGQVAIAGIGQQRYDYLARVFGTLGQYGSGIYRRARGYAYQHAFLMGDFAAGRERILVFYRDDLVIYLGVQRVRHKARADALNLVRAGYALGQYGGTRRLNRNHAHVRILGLQVFAHAGDGAAGAYARDEYVNLAFGIARAKIGRG